MRQIAAHVPSAWRLPRILCAALIACIVGPGVPWALAHKNAGKSERLPSIGPAPAFTLTDQNGSRFSSEYLRGKVGVVTFIFTSCSDTCPMLTAKLVAIQRQLGAEKPRVHFVAITVDPLNDTPAVLKQYGQAHSADMARFSFLTGSYEQINEVTSRFAVFHKKQATGSVDHSFLTSLIDPAGTLRVQYLGVRFDPKEFLADIRSLLSEKGQK